MSKQMDEMKNQLASLLEATIAPGQYGTMQTITDLIDNMIRQALVDSGVVVHVDFD